MSFSNMASDKLQNAPKSENNDLQNLLILIIPGTPT